MCIKSNLFLLLCFCIPVASIAGDLDSLYRVLDRTLEEHTQYNREKEDRIQGIRSRLGNDQLTALEKYGLHALLVEEYYSYLCDSAIHYLHTNIELASAELSESALADESKVQLAYLLGSCGMYKEAVDMLGSIDQEALSTDLFPDYLAAYDHVYGELSFYTQDPASSVRYRHVSDLYKDSLFQLLPKEHPLRIEMMETVYRDHGPLEKAWQINNERMTEVVPGTPEYALVAFHRSLICKAAGDTEAQKYYLTLSAISDIRSSTKDHASLWTLARLLYEEGDLERAYRYIRFSWNETNFYNAKLRSLQSAGILSLIDLTYQAMSERQNRTLQSYLILISALSLLLIAAMLYIYRQIKRLALARNHLQTANGQLKELNEELRQVNVWLKTANEDLSESNQIKEEYIARFIKLCSTYIDKLDAYRRMVHKKITGGQTAELVRITRSPESLDSELEELYTNFDTAFLHLFPDFVRKFNELLQPGEGIQLKKGELLNTELRIFALIRLGIEGSSQIAEFLRYSVNTIYNYRAKVKNKAAGSREGFEERVRQIR